MRCDAWSSPKRGTRRGTSVIPPDAAHGPVAASESRGRWLCVGDPIVIIQGGGVTRPLPRFQEGPSMNRPLLLGSVAVRRLAAHRRRGRRRPRAHAQEACTPSTTSSARGGPSGEPFGSEEKQKGSGRRPSPGSGSSRATTPGSRRPSTRASTSPPPLRTCPTTTATNSPFTPPPRRIGSFKGRWRTAGSPWTAPTTRPATCSGWS